MDLGEEEVPKAEGASFGLKIIDNSGVGVEEAF